MAVRPEVLWFRAEGERATQRASEPGQQLVSHGEEEPSALLALPVQTCVHQAHGQHFFISLIVP